jgi:flagellar biosynthesis protein FlhF
VGDGRVLSRNLKATESMTGICDEGGVVALIGATGVGKTTTAAKLAAQCVKQYGANSVGLITLDTYRVAGYEQLRAYGRMMGVVAHLAHDRAALKDLLTLLSGKRLVVIDTAGLGQKDPRIQDMLEVLEMPTIKKMLVLNASSHGGAVWPTVSVYLKTGPLHRRRNWCGSPWALTANRPTTRPHPRWVSSLPNRIRST